MRVFLILSVLEGSSMKMKGWQLELPLQAMLMEVQCKIVEHEEKSVAAALVNSRKATHTAH